MEKQKKDPIYIHTAFLLVLTGILYIIIQLLIIQPARDREKEKLYSEISQRNITGLSTLMELYQTRFGKYTDNPDSLIFYTKTILSRSQVDSIFPPEKLPKFTLDSLKFSPKTHKQYNISLHKDAERQNKFSIQCPDGYSKSEIK